MIFVHNILNSITDSAILLFELVGVIVIIVSGIRGVYSYIIHDPLVRLNMAKGMAMGLEFKLGSEILRTVIVRGFTEIVIVASIIALRAALTFLIHWEIKTEEAHHELKKEMNESKEDD